MMFKMRNAIILTSLPHCQVSRHLLAYAYFIDWVSTPTSRLGVGSLFSRNELYTDFFVSRPVRPYSVEVIRMISHG